MTLTEHPEWSIIDSSKLKDYVSCPRLYFYKHILGWKFDAPNIHLEFGTAWHKAMETLLQVGYSEDALRLAVIELTDHYRQFFPPIMDNDYFPKNPGFAADMLQKYAKEFADDHKSFDVLYTETSGTVPIANDRVIYFKTDSILQGKNGKYQGKKFSREHKTASRNTDFRKEWELSLQIGTYNHVLYCLYGPGDTAGVEMNISIFQKTKPGFSRVLIQKGINAMNLWLWEVNYWFDEISQHMDRLSNITEDDNIMTAFPRRTENCGGYGGCSYHDFCCNWANPLRHMGNMPVGMKQEFWDPRNVETTHKMEIS